jgi:hypothetical protein
MSSLKRKVESDVNETVNSDDEVAQKVKQNYESNTADLTSEAVSFDMDQETKDLEDKKNEQGKADNDLDKGNFTSIEISNISDKIMERNPALVSNDLTESQTELFEDSLIPKETEVPKKVREIKHPLSAWMIFSHENRELINKEQPSLTFTEGIL